MKNCVAGLAMVTWWGLFCPILPSVSAQANAGPIRVTTWDLQPSAAAVTNGLSNELQQSIIQDAAASLKKLNPDVILLQDAESWETCNQLVQALQPEDYQVVVCSAFRDARTKLPGRQVAILSKARASLAWSEPWQGSGESAAASGGFAFAAIRMGDKTIGVFSVELGDGVVVFPQASDDSDRQLAQQIDALQNWKTNWLQAFVAAGNITMSADVLPLVHEKALLSLEKIGFKSAFAGLPLRKQAGLPAATLDYIFIRDAGLAALPVTTQSALSDHEAATCDIDLEPRRGVLAELPPTESSNRPVAPGVIAATNFRTILWFAGGAVVFLALFSLARQRFGRPDFQLVPTTLPDLKAKTDVFIADPRTEQSINARPSGGAAPMPVEMADAVRAGVVANLSRWLKQKLVQRLVSDRSQLMAAQQAAAQTLLAVDERLAKVELHIQQRNQAYEQRIDDLLKALLAAREENRELIRAKIALVKGEMEKSRPKADQHGQEHQQF